MNKRLLEIGVAPGKYTIILENKHCVLIRCRGGLFAVDKEYMIRASGLK